MDEKEKDHYVPEFTHIEVRVSRSSKFLKQHRERGYFLSENIPIAEFWLPSRFWDMTEDDIADLKKWLLLKVFYKWLDLKEV